MRSVSVIIPVYNEADTVEQGVLEINSFLKNKINDYEIIIVESGSSDGTSEKCDKIAREQPPIKVIHEGGRYGFGSALKLGYRHATKDLLWLITTDLPFPLETILKAMPLLDKFDCVLSYRSHDPRKLGRRIMSLGYNIIAKVIFRLKVKSINSAFKVFKRDTIQNMSLVSTGWFIDTEIVYNIIKRKIPYTEIPVEVIDRKAGRSSIRFSDIIKYIREMVFFLKNKNL